MDVHRCRFVPYPAAEINALAFSHRSNPNEPNPPQLRLALGRSNGDIEIWNPLGGAWAQETILRGGKDRTIEGLAWTQDLDGETPKGKKTAGKLRLFSIGYSTIVTEWDLATGRAVRHSGGNYGEVWCMAAQPRWDGRDKKQGVADIAGKQEQHLALGCADGSVVLHSTADGDLTYVKTLPRSSGKKPRALSLAWHGRDKIVVGYSDSMIRVYEVSGRGRLLSSMSLGAGAKGGPSNILVWTVKALRDDTFASGDSTGEIKIWDARNYTLLQRLKSHLADVLSLVVSFDGSMLLSGGMDRRTILHQKSTPQMKGGKGRWTALTHQRHHKSDVKTMDVFESLQMSVVISGGLDATPIVNPLRTFGQEYHRALPPFPSTPVACSSIEGRLVMSWWNREASIWRVPEQTHLAEEVCEESESKDRKLVARIAIQGEESITSAHINTTGDVVAIATMSCTKLFHLRPRKSAATLRIQKIEVPAGLSNTGSKMIRFSPDGKWLVSSLRNNSIQLHRLVNAAESKQPWQVLDTIVEFARDHAHGSERVAWGTHGNYDHVISRFAWSSDSRIVVAGDLSGNLDSWVLEGNEDPDWTAAPVMNGTVKSDATGEESDEESDDEAHPQVILGQHWKPHAERLPRLPAAPIVISFRPDTKPIGEAQLNGNIGLHATRHNPAPHSHDLPHGEDRLLVITAKHDILEFNALSGKVTNWSKRNPTSIFPLSFRNVLDRAVDCLWHSRDGKERAWLYGSSWLWMFDLSKDMLLHRSFEGYDGQSQEPENTGGHSRKRKREIGEAETRQLIKQSVGAGSKMKNGELVLGTGSKLRIHNGEVSDEHAIETKFAAVKSKPQPRRDDDNSDDSEDLDEEQAEDSDEERSDALLRLRRGNVDEPNGHNHNQDTEEGEPAHDWHTFKYRPILGIVPLSYENAHNSLEVAIVERPLWEVGLKARWEGPQERVDR